MKTRTIRIYVDPFEHGLAWSERQTVTRRYADCLPTSDLVGSATSTDNTTSTDTDTDTQRASEIDEEITSGPYGEYVSHGLPDWQEDAEASRRDLEHVRDAALLAYVAAELSGYAWDPNDDGSLTITGPPDHSLIAIAH